MDLDDNTKAELRRGLRKIRNIEFEYSDLIPIIETKKKIPGTVINAFGAVLQKRAEGWPDGTPDWCIFSSWLADLVEGNVAQGPGVGTVRDHVFAAVSTYEKHKELASKISEILHSVPQIHQMNYLLEHVGSFHCVADSHRTGS
jgi:hypothetical protein